MGSISIPESKMPTGWIFRPMNDRDIDRVLEIIDNVDDDDCEEAADTYRESLDNHFVITFGNEVQGVTGFYEAEGTNCTCYLSWTYLADEYRGQGIGRKMLETLLEAVKQDGGRKIYVEVSDYRDETGEDIYGDARALYQKLGFREEARYVDHYDEGESKIIYGLRLKSKESRLAATRKDDKGIALAELVEIDETEGMYVIDWQYASDMKGFTVEHFEQYVQSAQESGGRGVMISFPSEVTQVLPVLRQSGFVSVGQLDDFYTDGVHELHFLYTL